MRRSRFPFVMTGVVLVFFYLPILILVVESFNSSRFGGAWRGFSLRWYGRLFHEPAIWESARNTLLIAVVVPFISLALGTTAALALHRFGRSRLQRVHYTLVYTPLVVPEILMGISLLMAFVAAGVSLGLGTIVLAHVTFCISYVALTVLGRLQDFDCAIREAARDLGARPFQAFRRVFLPGVRQGLVTAVLVVFIPALGSYVVPDLVGGTESEMLGNKIAQRVFVDRNLPLAGGLSIVLILAVLTPLLAVLALQRQAAAPTAGAEP